MTYPVCEDRSVQHDGVAYRKKICLRKTMEDNEGIGK